MRLFFIATCYAAALTSHQLESVLPQDLYINIIKKIITNTIYEDASYQNGQFNLLQREHGYDWPTVAHTMVGMKRLDNIQFCLEEVLKNQVPGDCIETGVWRGGACILMRAILKAHNDTTRKIWVADSFEGLPPPNEVKYPKDKDLNLYLYPMLAVSLDRVQSNFKKYDLLDNQVVFLKGLFADTLPKAPITQLALLRLDGDLYESTMDALVYLYPKLSIGGYIIIDDYGCIPACQAAVHDYRAQHNIQEVMIGIDYSGIYWQKTE
jgi:hypothetical protein